MTGKSDGTQTARAEPFGPVLVRVRSEDEDCDKKRIDDTVMLWVSPFDSFMGTDIESQVSWSLTSKPSHGRELGLNFSTA